MKQLLLVDDDREIRTLVAEHLTEAGGYQVVTAATGSEMRRKLERSAVDLIILDLNLRNEDGLTLCRELRARSSVPVIMLTARSSAIDRILGLEMGADDYLPKPFEPRELLARIRSVLRRAEALPPNLVAQQSKSATFDGWTLDFVHRQLTDPGQRVIMLSSAEFRLLKILINHAPQVISREQLLVLGAVKGRDAQDRAIDLQISRLRQKFGAAGMELIKTVRNEGYALTVTVTIE